MPFPHRDGTKAFYRAQCWHYGLTIRKTKDASKKVLLAALETAHEEGDGILAVPEWVQILEADLRARWEPMKQAAATQSRIIDRLLAEARVRAAAERERRQIESQQRLLRARQNDERLREWVARIGTAKGEMLAAGVSASFSFPSRRGPADATS